MVRLREELWPGARAVAARLAGAAVLAVLGISIGGFFAPASPASANAPILGSRSFAPPPYGKGYGTVRPRVVHSGGAAASYIFKIRWKRWGRSVSHGVGRGYWYRPGGGYYDRPIKVRLRARGLGYCGTGDRLAYTRLQIKRQRKPGGSYFPWSGSLPICG